MGFPIAARVRCEVSVVFCEVLRGFTYSFMIDESEVLLPVFDDLQGVCESDFVVSRQSSSPDVGPGVVSL